MTTIPAENFDIQFKDGNWQLIPQSAALSVQSDFWVTRGSGIMEYSPTFGESHRLPGTRLSVEYVRSVVIGYDEKTQRWRLGFHLARNPEEKPRWLELVRWPPGDNIAYAAPAQQAGRELAEHLGCPLRIFGLQETSQPAREQERAASPRPPVNPDQREDIGPQRVKLFAQSVKLPAQYPNMWLGMSRDGVILKLSKDIIESGKQSDTAPSYCQVVVDSKNDTVRLLPPTGLLSAFFGSPQGRIIKSNTVRNIELRHTVGYEHVAKPEGRGKRFMKEVTFTHYSWEVYLTLANETLLLAQTTHSTDSELSRKRAMAGDKFSVDTEAGIDYLRQHQEDQEAYEKAETYAWTIAVVIASHLNTHLIKTEVSPDGE